MVGKSLTVVRIGIILITLVIGMHLSGHTKPRVQLRCKNTQGTSIKQAAVGQPFIVQVKVDGSDQISEPRIEGIEQLRVLGRVQSVHMINGRTTITYQYTVQANQTETYHIGPAQVRISGTLHRSDAVNIEILDHVSVDTYNKNNRSTENIFVELDCSKKEVMIGEHFDYRLRFYFQRSKTHVSKVSVPSLEKEFCIDQKYEPIEGFQDINGTSYRYIEWAWRVHAQEAGSFIIPAHAIEYTVQQRRSSIFSMLLNNHQCKQAYSNQLSITVNPLPEHDTPVHAVGACSGVTLSVEPSCVQTGKAMTAVLSVTSMQPLSLQEKPELSGIDDSMRVYFSQQTMHDEDESYRYVFEYIVHACKEGAFTIPAQPFTYFDIEKRVYKTEYSNDCIITVNPGTPFSSEPSSVSPAASLTEKTLSEPVIDELASEKLEPLEEEIEQYYQRAALPWHWFLVCSILLIISLIVSIYWNNMQQGIEYLVKRFRFRFAFFLAHRSVRQAARAESYDALYGIFVKLYRSRTQRNMYGSYECLHELINQDTWSKKERVVWQKFIGHIAEPVFANHQLSYRLDKELFDQAHVWIDKLRDVL